MNSKSVGFFCGHGEKPSLIQIEIFPAWHYPANIYLFKLNDRNTRKGVKYVQS